MSNTGHDGDRKIGFEILKFPTQPNEPIEFRDKCPNFEVLIFGSSLKIRNHGMDFFRYLKWFPPCPSDRQKPQAKGLVSISKSEKKKQVLCFLPLRKPNRLHMLSATAGFPLVFCLLTQTSQVQGTLQNAERCSWPQDFTRENCLQITMWIATLCRSLGPLERQLSCIDSSCSFIQHVWKCQCRIVGVKLCVDFAAPIYKSWIRNWSQCIV